MRVSATARYVRGSTRKAHLVTQAIRGKRVEDAAALLRFMPQHAARDIALVLKSATANAENNHNLSAEDLVLALDPRQGCQQLFLVHLVGSHRLLLELPARRCQ